MELDIYDEQCEEKFMCLFSFYLLVLVQSSPLRRRYNKSIKLLAFLTVKKMFYYNIVHTVL